MAKEQDTENRIQKTEDIKSLDGQFGVIHVDDDDVIVLMTDNVYSKQAEQNILDFVKQKVGDRKILFLQEGLKIGVIKHKEATAAIERNIYYLDSNQIKSLLAGESVKLISNGELTQASELKLSVEALKTIGNFKF